MPVEAERAESYIMYMAVYLARNCPMCRNFFAVKIAKPNGSGYRPIHGRCRTCGYEIAWALISSWSSHYAETHQNRFSGKASVCRANVCPCGFEGIIAKRKDSCHKGWR